MATAVIMPRQGQSVETCILGQWYKEVGESVKTGDLLFSYETDKASFEEEAKADGILLVRNFEAGDEVPVLSEVGIIGEAGETILPGTDTTEAVSSTTEEEKSVVIEFPVEPGIIVPERIHISPLSRKMAMELGIDASSIAGTGPHGRIIARDVEAAFQKTVKTAAMEIPVNPVPEQKPAPVPAPPVVAPAPVAGDGFVLKPVSNIRKLIAKSMHASLQNSAQLTHHLSADARNLLAARKNYKAKFEAGKMTENVTLNDLICFAVIAALKRFPQVNTHFLGDQVKYFNKVNLGLAVDTDRGLMVPALVAADDYSITGLSARLQQLASDCRRGKINPDLLNPEAASFTISNLGNYGVEIFTPVINLPQTAILGVCAIVPRPKEISEGIYAIVPMLGLSLTYDHRSVDGGEATRFLAEIRSQIEHLEA